MPGGIFRIDADTAPYTSKLDGLVTATDTAAAKAGDALQRRLGAAQAKAAATATATMTQAGATAAATAGGFRQAEASIARTKEAVAGLGSALAVIDPTAGRVVMQISAVAGAGKSAAVALGGMGAAVILPLAAALAIAGGAWAYFSRQVKEAEERVEAAAAKAKAAEAAFSGLGAVFGEIADDVRIATGEIDKEGLALERRQARLAAAAEQGRRFYDVEIDAARRRRRELEEGGVAPRELGEYDRLGTAVDAYSRELDALNERTAEASSNAAILVAHTRSEREASEAAAEAARGLASAQRQRAEVERQVAESIRESEAADAARAAASASIQAATEAAIEDTLSAEDRLFLSRERLIAQLAEQELASGDTAAADAARAEVEARYVRDLDALRADAAENEKARLDSARAEADRAALAELQREKELSASKYQLGAASLGAVQTFADLAVQARGKEAMGAWRISQAAAMAQIGLTVAQQVAEGIATLNPFLTAAAVVGGIAATAQVAAAPPPSFYSGGETPYASPRGSLISQVVHPGERVRVESRSDVERGRGARETVVATYIDGAPLARTTAREIRRGGPLSREMRARYGVLGHYQPSES